MKLRKSNRMIVQETDIFDILSAIWILACNDENPIITFGSVSYRLNLPADFDVEALIRSRADLFRMGVPENRILEWKDIMSKGKHIPSWIKDIDDEDARNEVINSLSGNSAFRSQFRVEKDAEKAPIEVIEWGLQHINRLRLANLESQTMVTTKTQIWIILGLGIFNLVASLLEIFLKLR